MPSDYTPLTTTLSSKGSQESGFRVQELQNFKMRRITFDRMNRIYRIAVLNSNPQNPVHPVKEVLRGGA
jgi:hypothetical protein